MPPFSFCQLTQVADSTIILLTVFEMTIVILSVNQYFCQ